MKSAAMDPCQNGIEMPFIYSNEGTTVESLSVEDQITHQFMLKIMNKLPEPTFELVTINSKLSIIQNCYSKAVEKINQKFYIAIAGKQLNSTLFTLLPKELLYYIFGYYTLVVNKSFKNFNEESTNTSYKQVITLMEFRVTQLIKKELFLSED